ncbi:MAG: hypothetical protein NVS1B4_15920 [Gemmatimonadaceae bacterium]
MIAAVIGAIVAAAAMLAIAPHPVGVFYDDALYVILAKALASGEGYRFLNLPGAPPATHYPPAYPALLALLWKLDPRFPHNVVLFKVANAALLGLGASWSYLLGRRHFVLHPAAASLAVVAGALCMPVLAVTGVLFSEPLFLVTLCGALLVVEKLAADAEPPPTRLLVAGALCGFVVLVRTIGVALPLGAAALLLARKGWRVAGPFAGAAAFVVAPWIVWTIAYGSVIPPPLRGSYGTYGGWFGDTLSQGGLAFAAAVVGKNLADFPRPFASLFAGGAPPPMAWAILAALATLALFGLVRLRRTAPITACVMLAYEAIVVAWPYPPDRFLWGVWPLVMMLLAAGATEAFAGGWPRRWTLHALPLAALAAGTVVASAGYASYEWHGVRGQWWATAQRQSAAGSATLVAWVASRTDSGAVVATDSDPLVYLYTGRRTLPTSGWSAVDYVRPAPDDSVLASVQALLDGYAIDYYLVAHSPGGVANAARSLEQQPHLRLAFQNRLPGGGAAFKVLR